jgi:hypothetical protein
VRWSGRIEGRNCLLESNAQRDTLQFESFQVGCCSRLINQELRPLRALVTSRLLTAAKIVGRDRYRVREEAKQEDSG